MATLRDLDLEVSTHTAQIQALCKVARALSSCVKPLKDDLTVAFPTKLESRLVRVSLSDHAEAEVGKEASSTDRKSLPEIPRGVLKTFAEKGWIDKYPRFRQIPAHEVRSAATAASNKSVLYLALDRSTVIGPPGGTEKGTFTTDMSTMLPLLAIFGSGECATDGSEGGDDSIKCDSDTAEAMIQALNTSVRNELHNMGWQYRFPSGTCDGMRSSLTFFCDASGVKTVVDADVTYKPSCGPADRDFRLYYHGITDSESFFNGLIRS